MGKATMPRRAERSLSRRQAGPAVLAICGWSGSGKTALIEAVLPRLIASGLKVAVVKHDVHGVNVDAPGKDSDRLFRAGADVLLAGPGESLVRKHQPGGTDLKTDLETALALLGLRYDVVLVEGGKRLDLPKVWLLGGGETRPPAGVPGILAALPRTQHRPQRFCSFLEGWLVRR